MYHPPAASHRRRWLVMLTVVVVVSTVATVVVSLSQEDRTVGTPRPAPTSESAGPVPHELTELTRIEATGYPKSEGMPSAPDETSMEVHGDSAYVVTFTGTYAHLTAVNLTDGEIAWQQDLAMQVPPTGFHLVATNEVLLVRVTYGPSYVDNIAAHDLATGEVVWHQPGKLSHVVANRVITYDSETDTVNALELSSGDKLWSVPADGGRASEYPQETAESRAQPRDTGDEQQATFSVAANTDENQHLVQAFMYSGAISVLELATGKVLAQGTAGDRVVQVVAYEDDVYVYRQTPRELKAYAATDLSKPKWSVQTPPSADGAHLDMCGDRLLCLKTVAGDDTPIQAVDAETGHTRWQTDEYTTPLAPTMAGDRVVLSHTGGTAILDPATGDPTATFDSRVYALPGAGEVVGLDGRDLELSQPNGKTVSLGTAPGTALTGGTCEWTRSVVLCAEEDYYQLWRYRD